MLKHINIQIKGRVQGVGFRHFVREEAAYLKVLGFVKNVRDGSVYAEAEAEPEVLEVFIERCKVGTSYSRVEQVIVSESNYESFNTFEIR